MDDAFSIVGTVEVSADDANEQLGKITENLGDMGTKGAPEASSGISALGIAVGDFIGNIATQAVDALGQALEWIPDQIQACIDVAAGLQDTWAQLDQTAQDLGADLPESLANVQAISDTMDQTTTNSASSLDTLMLKMERANNIGGQMFQPILQGISDLAAGSGRSLASIGTSIERIMEDPSTGVARLKIFGIDFTAAQQDLLKKLVAGGDIADAQQVILDAIEKSYSGDALKSTQTYDGQLKTLGNTFDDIKNKIGQAVLPMLTNLVTGFHTLISDPRVIAFFTNLSTTISSILTPLGAVFGIITGTGAPDALGILYNSMDQAFGVEMGGKIVNVVTSLGNLFTALTTGGDKSAALAGVGTAIKNVVPADTQTKISGVMTTITNVVDGFGKVFSKIFGTMLPPLVKDFTGLAATMSAFWKEHGDQIMHNLAIMGLVLGAIFTVAVAVVAGALGLLGGIIKGALDFAMGIFDVFSDVFSGNWSKAWTDLKDTVSTVFMDLVGGITNFLNTILSVFGTNLPAIGNLFHMAWVDVSTFFSTQWAIAWAKIQLLWSTIQTWCAQVVTGVKNTFQGLVLDLTTIGNDIINGLLSGFKSAWAAVTKWITDAANQVADLFKKVTGTHSPSTVFAQIGSDLMAGLAQGISKSVPTVAINQAVNSMVGAASSANVSGGSSVSGGITFNITESKDARDTAQQIAYILKLNGIQPMTIPVQR